MSYLRFKTANVPRRASPLPEGIFRAKDEFRGLLFLHRLDSDLKAEDDVASAKFKPFRPSPKSSWIEGFVTSFLLSVTSLSMMCPSNGVQLLKPGILVNILFAVSSHFCAHFWELNFKNFKLFRYKSLLKNIFSHFLNFIYSTRAYVTYNIKNENIVFDKSSMTY